MARPVSARRQSASRPSAPNSRLERLVGIITGVIIIIFIMALIWRGQPIADPNLARMARIVLALGVGAVGATIPGFLHVDYSLKGVAVRGAGGLAVFLIAFFGSPRVEALHLTTGELRLQPLEQIEFRVLNAPGDHASIDPNAQTAVTIYVQGSNPSDQLGRPVEIVRTSLQVAAGPLPPLRFEWKYFVQHITGDSRLGNSPPEIYLGAMADASPITIPPGMPFDRSILHVSDPTDPAAAGWHWRSALDAALNNTLRSVRVVIETREQGSFVTDCAIDGDADRANIQRFVSQYRVLPLYFQANCRGGAQWRSQAQES